MNKMVVANFKMNLSLEDVELYVQQLKGNISDKVNVVICPSFPFLFMFKSDEYKVGAQNSFYLNEGSFTGEVSTTQLKSLGVSYIIVGHSERRLYSKEDNDLINNKIKNILSNNLKPILCIGETKEERALHKTSIVIKKQIEQCLKDMDKDMLSDLTIAYEPIWAIGSGLTPKIVEIEETVNYIKTICLSKYKADNIKVLYGGSVNRNNIREINNIGGLDGVLVGSASWSARGLIEIVNNIE
jgi:triosephosphate isomerase (TIM)